MLITSFIVLIIIAFLSIFGLIAEEEGKYKIQYTVITIVAILAIIYIATNN